MHFGHSGGCLCIPTPPTLPYFDINSNVQLGQPQPLVTFTWHLYYNARHFFKILQRTMCTFKLCWYNSRIMVDILSLILHYIFVLTSFGIKQWITNQLRKSFLLITEMSCFWSSILNKLTHWQPLTRAMMIVCDTTRATIFFTFSSDRKQDAVIERYKPYKRVQ